MFALRIVAISLCVASLQFLAECSLSDKDRREIYLDDLKRADKDGCYSSEDGKKVLASMLFGNTQLQADTAYKFLNSAWIKSDDSKRLLEALGSLKECIAQHRPKDCDLNVYDRLLSIVRMSDKYFEGKSIRHKLARMLLFKMHDAFATKCVHKLRSDLYGFYSTHGKEVGALEAFKPLLGSKSLDTVREESYPNKSPSMVEKLDLVPDGDEAWYQFLINAEVRAKDDDLISRLIPRKEKTAAEIEFVVNSSCVPLSQSEKFISFVNELSSFSRKLVFDLVNNAGLEHDFQQVEKYVAMYKICMKLKELGTKELVEKVQTDTRAN